MFLNQWIKKITRKMYNAAHDVFEYESRTRALLDGEEKELN